MTAPNVLPCSTSTLAQNQKIDPPDRPNSHIGGTCFVGCAPWPELASGDNFRVLSCVGENDGMTFSYRIFARWPGDAMHDQQKPGTKRSRRGTGKRSQTAPHIQWLGQLARSPPTIPRIQMNLLKTTCGIRCWNWFCHADIGIPMAELADDMVLAMIALDTLCDKIEPRKYVGVATIDSSQDCTDVTSGAAGYTGSASTSESCPGSRERLRVTHRKSPNCSPVSSAADGFTSAVSHDRDRIVFLESCCSPCSDGDASMLHLLPGRVHPTAFLSETLQVSPFAKSCLAEQGAPR